jgi:hypothetical protein
MPEVSTTSKVAIKRFWDQFVDRARGNGVKGAALRWHVLRAEEYLKTFPDKRLSEHSAEDVTGYLEVTVQTPPSPARLPKNNGL